MGREDGIWAGVGVGWDVEQCEESRKKELEETEQIGSTKQNRRNKYKYITQLPGNTKLSYKLLVREMFTACRQRREKVKG